MENTIGLLEGLSGSEWRDLFSRAEQEESKELKAQSKGKLYRYLGEIDCPEEMFSDFATVEDVARSGGKANWFVCSDGTFFTCGDYAVDFLFESGKVVDYIFPFEIERNEKYDFFSKEERISFRVNTQGISESEAKEIVCYELGVPAYDNSYLFSYKEVLVNSIDNSEKERSGNVNIVADTEEEAREKLISQFHKVGSVVESGTVFSDEDRVKMRQSGKFFGYKGGTPYTVTLRKLDFDLLEVKKNDGGLW